MIDVQKNIPVPHPDKTVPRGPRRKYPFETMQVGDMFFVPHKTRNTLMSHVSVTGKSLGKKFTTRLTYMVESLDGWKQATKDTPHAVQGIGVWRIA